MKSDIVNPMPPTRPTNTMPRPSVSAARVAMPARVTAKVRPRQLDAGVRERELLAPRALDRRETLAERVAIERLEVIEVLLRRSREARRAEPRADRREQTQENAGERRMDASDVQTRPRGDPARDVCGRAAHADRAQP